MMDWMSGLLESKREWLAAGTDQHLRLHTLAREFGADAHTEFGEHQSRYGCFDEARIWFQLDLRKWPQRNERRVAL